jgi:hypothetical protein
MRQGKLGLWLAVAVAIVSALGSQAGSARWEVTLHLAPVGVELTASTEHARVALKL